MQAEKLHFLLQSGAILLLAANRPLKSKDLLPIRRRR